MCSGEPKGRHKQNRQLIKIEKSKVVHVMGEVFWPIQYFAQIIIFEFVYLHIYNLINLIQTHSPLICLTVDKK